MSFAVACQVIGFISASISITNFMKSEMAEKQDQYDSAVRIAVALNKAHHFKDADGTSPMILAFNENGEHIGHSSWERRGHIATGSYKDIIIHQDEGPGQQATTLQVCAMDDAVCVAYISQTWSDGANRGWLGDMGRSCGASWYYSNVIVGDQDHKPTCTWLDQNHSEDIPTSALQIHMQDFVQLSEEDNINDDPRFYCRLPAMLLKRKHSYDFGREMWDIYNKDKAFRPGDFTLWTGPEEDDLKAVAEQRKLRRRIDERPFVHLITSPHEVHGAKALCESDSSHGPDFVSWSERIHCDMSTKQVRPLCEGDESGHRHCYHHETQSLVFADMDTRLGKNYSHVVEWD